jgi:hypothetical protein
MSFPLTPSAAYVQCLLPFVTLCGRSPSVCPLVLSPETVWCERCGSAAPIVTASS